MAKRRIEQIENEIQNANGTELFIVSDHQSGKYITKKMDINTIRNYVREGGDVGVGHAFPDYNHPEPYTMNTTITKPGFLKFQWWVTTDTRFFHIEVNGQRMVSFQNNTPGIVPMVMDSDILPVSPGDIVRLYTKDTSTSDSVYKDGITVLEDNENIYGLMWNFYPAKGVAASSSTLLAGDGGVLDGELYTLRQGQNYTLDQNGTCAVVDSVHIYGDDLTSGAHRDASLVYTAQNDCGLYMEDERNGGGHSDIECQYWFDAEKTKPIFKHTQTDGSVDQSAENNMGYQGTIVFVKAGTKIYASAPYHNNNSYSEATRHRFRFYEYKISSLNPQQAFPDYAHQQILHEQGVADEHYEYSMPGNGWILTNVGPRIQEAELSDEISSVYVKINNVGISEHMYSNAVSDDQVQMRPVSKGDIVKLEKGDNNAPDIRKWLYIFFIPAKGVPAETSSGLVVPDYSAYDESEHKVSSSDIMTFGNGNNMVQPNKSYVIYIDKSSIGDRCWKARQDCFFFPCAYARGLPNTTGQDTIWPLHVFVGDENGEKLFKVFSHDGSDGKDLCASWMVPLKKGQIIALWNGGSSLDAITPDSYWLPVKS